MKSFIDRVKSDKLLFFLSVLIIGLFLVLIIRITYSYLAASINEAGNNVTMGSDKTDELKFIKGDNLVLNATSTTLPEGGANYVDSTTYSASLKANSTNNTANYTYYVYFNIPTNTINYIEENTPEVILTISQGDNEITNINGLTYGTYNGVSGFDITNKSGSFNIASDYLITSNSSENATIQDWTFTLTYLNQNYDQSANYGNSMNVEIIMSKDEIDNTLATYIKNLYTDGSNGLYYHDANLENGAADNSYRYAGANPNNYVCFGSTASTCPSDNLYRIIGVFGSEVKLIKSDYTTTTMTGSGGDYYGAYSYDTSNYKGSMNTSNIASYYWNRSNGTSSTNTWSASRLNKTNLNSSYLSYIGTTWSNKIATHTWYVGGYSTNAATPKTFYNAESSGTTYSAKIGLMYVSDYGYAASNSYWTTNMNYYDSAKNNNWMHMGLYEWTISRNSSYSNIAFRLNFTGFLSDIFVYNNSYAVRPSFYLTPSTTYVSGSGSSADPIRIS